METLIQTIPKQATIKTLELIEGCDKKIVVLMKEGQAEDRLEMRQERYLRKDYVNQLQKLLKEAGLVD